MKYSKWIIKNDTIIKVPKKSKREWSSLKRDLRAILKLKKIIKQWKQSRSQIIDKKSKQINALLYYKKEYKKLRRKMTINTSKFRNTKTQIHQKK